jgi:hypothetical protein
VVQGTLGLALAVLHRAQAQAPRAVLHQREDERYQQKRNHVGQQAADAFAHDIGISTPLYPDHWGDCTQAETACRAAPDCQPLIIECGLCLNEAGRYRDWVNLVSELPVFMQAKGRVRLLRAQAELALGNLDEATRFFTEGALVPDLREGENSISDLWVQYKIQQMCQENNFTETHPEVFKFRESPPIPEGIDYRMRG